MSLPSFTMRDLLEAGVHYGHTPRRWNPKMAPYLFGVRNNIHIINLEKTVPLLNQALQVTHDIVKNSGRILFVGTKNQASDIIKEYAEQCGQYFVNHRWLGGMMTNWNTVSQSIKSLTQYEEQLADESTKLTKKERLKLQRSFDKLNRAIGGIREMGGVPDLLIIIDTNKEDTAVKEAIKLGIPIIAIVDSNSDPTVIDYPVPGNDDAIRSISFYCNLFSKAILDGMQAQMVAAGIDVGGSAELPVDATTPKATQKTPAKAGKSKPEKQKKAETKVEAAKEVKEDKKVAEKKVEVAPTPEAADGTKENETKKPAATKAKVKKVATAKAEEKKAPVKKATEDKADTKKPATKKAAIDKKSTAAKKVETETEK